MVGEQRTDLKGPTITLERGKYYKLIFSVMLWNILLSFREKRVQNNYEDTSIIEFQKRVFPMLKLYPSTAGWPLIERLDIMEMRLRLPAFRSQRKPISDTQEILERLPDNFLQKRLWPDYRKFCELHVPSFTP